MWILLYKLFKIGFKEAKKHKAKKAAAANTPDQARSFNTNNTNNNQPPYPNPTFHPDGHNPPYSMPTASFSSDASPPPPAHLPPQTPPETHTQSTKEKIKYYLDSLLRTLQLALCLAIIGLYGSTLNKSREDGTAPPSKWVYAVVAGFLGGLTALVYLVVGAVRPNAIKRAAGLRLVLFAWESVLCVLFLVLFGVFGGMFIGVYGDGKDKGYPEGVDVTKMRRAVWVDLVALGVWVGTAGWAGLRWWRGNREGEVGGVGKEEDLEMNG